MRELHPYGEFIPKQPKAMIIGSFPIGKFTNPQRRHEIKSHEYDFFFGGERNLLWKLLGEVFGREINSKNNIIQMLEEKGLAVGDVIRSCKRINGGASDTDLVDIEWNDGLLMTIRKYRIRKIYFTSKKVETWFKRIFKNVDDLDMVTLISPSAQSVRALSRRPDFQAWWKFHPDEPKLRFILQHYQQEFRSIG